MVKLELAKYLEEALLFQFDTEITESTDLFKAGVIDSFGYIKLIRHIEQTFKVKFSREELLSNVVTSLISMTAAVEAKMESGKVPSNGQRH